MHIRLVLTILLHLLSIGLFAQQQKANVLIKNACVFIGDGKDSVFMNVAITNKRISYVGKELINADEVIDAKGKYLAPGFIDTHTHADRWIEDRKRNQMLPWIYQGVTSVFAGNDGFGTYKVAEQMKKYQQIGMGTNFALYVGFGPVRQAVLGDDNKMPDATQILQMKTMIASGMQSGAIGFSTGLIYLPQMYAKTDEIASLYQEAAKWNAIYDTHMRNEGAKVLESIDETIKIGADFNLPIHISHLKVSGESAWGKSEEVIAKINAARAKGLKVTANQYPFIASMTSLKATLMPDWAQEGGAKATLARFENEDELSKIKRSLQQKSPLVYKRVVLMSKDQKLAQITGKSVAQIAEEWGVPVEDAVITIFKMDIGVSCVNFSMSEEDVINFMKQPWVMTGSDGGGLHPRTYATFTKIITDYVLQKKVMSMSWAIHRATGLTAETFGIKDRGLVKEGFYADLIVFDPKKVKVNSTFANPEQLSEGMEYVFVNGVKAVEQGKGTGSLSGEIIKK
ncbi:N-acyl-D-amino-acid deacylase family protein [Pedobacter sp.]